VIQLDDDPRKLEPSWWCVGSKITTRFPPHIAYYHRGVPDLVGQARI
jgi:hypothetical protein